MSHGLLRMCVAEFIGEAGVVIGAGYARKKQERYLDWIGKVMLRLGSNTQK